MNGGEGALSKRVFLGHQQSGGKKVDKKCLVSLLLLGVSGPALADIEFANVDVDSDGFITVEEAAVDPGLSKVFADFDADKDGKMNEEEFNEATEVAEPADKGG